MTEVEFDQNWKVPDTFLWCCHAFVGRKTSPSHTNTRKFILGRARNLHICSSCKEIAQPSSVTSKERHVILNLQKLEVGLGLGLGLLRTSPP